MKLEVGMYVRTKDGIKQIYKIDNNKTKWKYLYKLRHQDEDGTIDLGMLCDDNIIGEPSFDIIDLIEINDIVQLKESTDNYSKSYFIGIDEMATLRTMEERIENNNLILESILTKEQFENNCFRIGDK